MGVPGAEAGPLDVLSVWELEVATLELEVEGHVERMIDRQALYERLETPAERRA
jgi:hypothetical protein